MSPPTLQVSLGSRQFALHAGESASLRSGDTYRDISAASMQRVLGRIADGIPWRDAVRGEYAESNRWLCDIVLSPARTRFLEFHRPAPGGLVLDVGAGWGQTTLPLAPSNPVVAVEPTPERLDFIRAAASQDGLRERIYFVEASMMETSFEPVFDYVACIGVLEWVAKFESGSDARAIQVDFLRRLRRSLRPGGHCCVGIENRLGLKYLLGARDDHTSLRDISVLDAGLANERHRAQTGQALRVFTYTLAEYRDLFREGGFEIASSWGAFPDYKLPALILPLDPPEEFNRQLCHAGVPADHDGIDGSPLPNHAELASHYRSLAKMDLAHAFSPSFFFLLR